MLAFAFVVPLATPALAADPVQVQTTLEGCRLPDNATSCVYPDDFTTGNLGKNWAELDLVPHRLTLTNNDGAQTFDIRISADHLLGGVKGYDFLTTPSASGACTLAVLEENVVSPTGVVGGVDKVLTTLLRVTMPVNGSCAISYAARLAIGSHLYSGSSLQTQVLEADYDSIGQRTVSIPVREIAPQAIGKTAAAFTTPTYTWTVTKSSPTESVTLDSCAPAPTEPNVSYTVSYTRTKVAGDVNTVSGTITLTNPANRSLVASITDTVKRDGTPVGGGTLPDVTVPANGSAIVPYSFSISAGTGTLSNTASATYHDPDVPGVDLPALSTTVAVPVSVTELPGLHATANINDTETASSGLQYSRVSPQPTSGFVSTDSFSTAVSDSGSFTISKIVKAVTAGNYDGTLQNDVTLTPDGAQASTASVSIPIHVTATDPTLTINKSVDVAPSAPLEFSFTITNKQTSATTGATVTIAAGATSGSATVSVAPSASGYTVTETSTPEGYNGSVPVDASALAYCGSGSVSVTNTRQPAGLSLVKTVDLAVAAYGDTLTYGLTVKNTNQRPLHTVEVTDVIPDGTTYVAGSAACPSPCVASFDTATNSVHFAVGDLAPGASFTGMTYRVTIDSPPPAADGSIPAGRIVNTATTSAPPDVPGPVLSNEVVTIVQAVLGKKLVRTGASVFGMLWLATALLFGGAAMTVTASRRRPEPVRDPGRR